MKTNKGYLVLAAALMTLSCKAQAGFLICQDGEIHFSSVKVKADATSLDFHGPQFA